MESARRTILDMNGQYQTLFSCLEKWSVDASPVVLGDAS